jgi:hypothetical protein
LHGSRKATLIKLDNPLAIKEETGIPLFTGYLADMIEKVFIPR